MLGDEVDRDPIPDLPPAEPTDAQSVPGEPTVPSMSPSDLRRGGRWSTTRIVVIAIAAIALLLVGYYLITLWQVWSVGRSDQARPVDAIVVMGAAQYDGRPSPQLAARLDQVVEIWPQGYASLVVVTGGNQTGDRFTEAETSAAYLVERGVPESVIVLENSGSTTIESLNNVEAILSERGLSSVLIVTDPYHALRSRLVAEEQGLVAYVSPTTSSVVTGANAVSRHLKEAAGIAVGRVVGFGRLAGLTG